MKTIIVALVLAFTSVSFAQNKEMKREKHTPEEQVEMQLKKLTSELDLTSDQQSKIKPILMEQAQKREEKKAGMMARRESGEKLTMEEKSEMREKMMEEKSEMKEKLKTILSPEQMEKWENDKVEKREKMKERMEKRKNAKMKE